MMISTWSQLIYSKEWSPLLEMYLKVVTCTIKLIAEFIPVNFVWISNSFCVLKPMTWNFETPLQTLQVNKQNSFQTFDIVNKIILTSHHTGHWTRPSSCCCKDKNSFTNWIQYFNFKIKCFNICYTYWLFSFFLKNYQWAFSLIHFKCKLNMFDSLTLKFV